MDRSQTKSFNSSSSELTYDVKTLFLNNNDFSQKAIFIFNHTKDLYQLDVKIYTFVPTLFQTIKYNMQYYITQATIPESKYKKFNITSHSICNTTIDDINDDNFDLRQLYIIYYYQKSCSQYAKTQTLKYFDTIINTYNTKYTLNILNLYVQINCLILGIPLPEKFLNANNKLFNGYYNDNKSAIIEPFSEQYLEDEYQLLDVKSYRKIHYNTYHNDTFTITSLLINKIIDVINVLHTIILL